VIHKSVVLVRLVSFEERYAGEVLKIVENYPGLPFNVVRSRDTLLSYTGAPYSFIVPPGQVVKASRTRGQS